MLEPTPPDNTRNWKALDIYLFDNGQSYSPPRKYHLVMDQLVGWPVTLNYLANAQYGLIDRNIDLYTIDGHKIQTPLELENETTYVAVIPPEPFIEAEYKKYLIRASKSWDRRQSLRDYSNIIAHTLNSHTSVAPLETAEFQKESSDVKYFHADSIQTPEESILIPTISANKPAEKQNLVVEKSTGNIDKRTTQNNVKIFPTIKNNKDKRSSTQQFLGNKKPGSSLQPVPVKKPSFKRRESLGLVEAKTVSPPTIAKRLKYPLTEGNLPSKRIVYKSNNPKSTSNSRNSTQPVLSNVDEVIYELRKYSNEKPNLKQMISLNENESITNDDKNADSIIKPNLSAIYINITTLKDFKDGLKKKTVKTDKGSFSKILENEIVNKSKWNNIQAKEEQIPIETPVNETTNKIENGPKQHSIEVKKEKFQGREKIPDLSNNNYSNVADKVNVKNVQNQMSSKPTDYVSTNEIKIHDNNSKPGSFRKSVNNSPSEAHKKNPSKFASQKTTNRSVDVVPSTADKNQDNNLEPSSEMTIENFIDFNNIENISSAVYRAEVETLNGNYPNVLASTPALVSDMAPVNFVDKASNTDEVKTLSVNDKIENMHDNTLRSVNNGSDKLVEKLSTTVGREDVVNLKLSIDIWNHDSAINSRSIVASMSKSPYISKQNESQGNIPDESNVTHKSLETWSTTNKNNLKDDQKIIVIKYVSRQSRHSKDEKENSNENPNSDDNHKDFIIILPILQLDHLTGCCNHCQQKDNEENAQKAQKQRVSSIKYPVRKTTSCTHGENKEAENRHADAPVDQSKEPSIIYEGLSEIRESIDKRKSVAINEELTSKESSYNISTTSENTNKNQLIVIHDKKSDNLGKRTDKAIQTGWCDLVLEARLQEAGHYALFLPTIERLKQYKLHAN